MPRHKDLFQVAESPGEGAYLHVPNLLFTVLRLLFRTLDMNAITTWVAKHPFQASLHLFNGVVFVEPRVATTPLFYLAGAGKDGPRRGICANIMFVCPQLMVSRLVRFRNDELAWFRQG